MNRQIVLSPLTLVLAVGLVLAALVIAVLATVMLAGGGDASIPAQAGLPSATSTAPAAAAVASPSIRPAEVTATEEVPPTPMPAPTEPILPTPTPVAIVVQATAVQPTPAPTPEMPACVAQVVAADYSGYVGLGTVTVINELTGKSTTFPDRGFGMWVAGACAARQGSCAVRVIGYVYYVGGGDPLDGTTTVVSEITGEVSSFVATGVAAYLPGACVSG